MPRLFINRPLPFVEARRLVAWSFSRRFGLGHPLRHLRLDRFEIEARAALHRREVEEGLEFLADDLLDEHEAPELILEPVEILLRAVLRPIVRPARALERIEAQVGDIGNVGVGLFAEGRGPRGGAGG